MSIKKNISFTFSAQILNTVIGFVTSIVITRILGAEGRGEHAIYTNSIAFAVLFFGFSLNSTIPYFINSGKAKADELLSTMIIFMIGSTFLVYFTLYLFQKFGLLGLALPESIQSLKFRIIFTAVYFVTLLNAVLTTYLLAYKKFKEVSIYGVAFQLFPAIIYALLYADILPYNRQNPFESVVYIMALFALLSVIAVIIVFIKILPIRPSTKLIPFSLVRQFMLFSSLAYLGNVATFFNYKLDFWIVDSYWGKSQLGIYSLASQLSQLLWILPAAISSVLYTYASNCSQETAVGYAIRLKQIAFLGTLLLGIIGLILAYFFIPVLYGNAFIPAFGLMKIFMIGVIPFSIPTVLASFFAARGNFRISFVISIVILFFSVAMYFAFIPMWGIIGGAISSAVAYLLASVMCEFWFCKSYKVSLFNLVQFDQSIFSKKGLLKFFK